MVRDRLLSDRVVSERVVSDRHLLGNVGIYCVVEGVDEAVRVQIMNHLLE